MGPDDDVRQPITLEPPTRTPLLATFPWVEPCGVSRSQGVATVNNELARLTSESMTVAEHADCPARRPRRRLLERVDWLTVAPVGDDETSAAVTSSTPPRPETEPDFLAAFFAGIIQDTKLLCRVNEVVSVRTIMTSRNVDAQSTSITFKNANAHSSPVVGRQKNVTYLADRPGNKSHQITNSQARRFDLGWTSRISAVSVYENSVCVHYDNKTLV